MDIISAILALDPNAQVSVNGESLDGITWHDGNPNNITNDQITAKQAELQADYDAKQYQRDRAKEYHQKDLEEISKKIKDLGLENDLINHKGLTPGMLVTLGEQNILKLSDFADLASDELTGSLDEIKGEKVKIRGYLEDFALSKKEADELIMSARDKIYKV